MTASAPMRLYEPLDVLKPVSNGLWVVDGGVTWMTLALGVRIPFPTRMVVVQLPSGALVLWSPVAPSGSLRAQLDALGPVSHLVSPNKLHYAQVEAWKHAYPSATTWASPGVRERAKEKGIAVSFDADLGDAAEAAWDGVLDQMLFRGSRFVEEVVFFHRPSGTLVLADLVENFEPSKLGPVMAATMRVVGATDPNGKATLNYRMTFRGNHNAARRSFDRMMEWTPDRVIIAHGRWYERDGATELRRAFRWLAP